MRGEIGEALQIFTRLLDGARGKGHLVHMARVLLAMSHHPHPRQVEGLEAAAAIFERQGGLGRHAKAVALVGEAGA